jgi:hypothetical protein
MDAATSVDYGGVLKIGDVVECYRGVWPTKIQNAILRIEILEALTVILTALTWGPRFAGSKVLFRFDNTGAVFCLNKMHSKCPAMKLIIDQWEAVWEAVQHHFGFEAMIFHVAGSDNEHADDVASRAAEDEVHAKLTEVLRADKIGDFTLNQIPVVWKAGKARGDIINDLIALRPKF